MDPTSSYVLVIAHDSAIGRAGARFVEVKSTQGLESILGKCVRVRVCTDCNHVAMSFFPKDDKFKSVEPGSDVSEVLRELMNPYNILQGETWGTDLADVTRCTVVGAFTVCTLRTFGECYEACARCMMPSTCAA